VVGSPAEVDLCREVARLVGNALCLAGRTSLADLAAVFESAAVVIANDSGAMHLAAAAGAAVAAIFGQTDPARTGPLGARVAVIQESEVRNRDIPRHSAAAARSLAKITPDRVFEVARALALGNNAPHVP
jgi:ADP-heptose:LPS heptosyltransferase